MKRYLQIQLKMADAAAHGDTRPGVFECSFSNIDCFQHGWRM